MSTIMDKYNDIGFPLLSWQDVSGRICQMSVEDRVYIGRVCQGAPAQKRIIINEPNVSRDHATISRIGRAFLLKDTSRNGTRINGVRVTPGSESELKDGDRISIGQITLHINIQSSDARSDLVTDDATRITAVTETMTHLVVDVRGFSSLAQRSKSSSIFDLVSDLYHALTDAVHRHYGTVKDFAGDAVYAFWEHGEQVSAQKALSACMAAKEQFSAVQNYLRNREQGDPMRNINLGWGISTGAATLSHYGIRQDNLALVGDSTNLAFRLAAMANNELSTPVVICSHTAKQLGDAVSLQDMGWVETKGRQGKERIYSISTA